MTNPNRPTTNPTVLFPAMVRRVARLSSATGEITLPAVPALLETYATMLEKVFEALTRPVAEDQRARLREALHEQLEEGFSLTPHAKIVVTYETDKMPEVSLSYMIHHVAPTMEDEYQAWVEGREPPLFGAYPDAKVMDVAHTLRERLGPRAVTCLDVGAGTGRNTLPLARDGFHTDAVEPAAALADILEGTVSEANLPVGVVRGSILDEGLSLPRERYGLVFLSEVVASHFRSIEEVRLLFRRLATLVEPGGVALFNAFVAVPGYTPDKVARDFAQYCWCPVYTRAELEEAKGMEPLALVADESAQEYEREHLPTEQWPPTSWYVDWSTGRDLFDLPLEKCPVEMRWLTYERGR